MSFRYFIVLLAAMVLVTARLNADTPAAPPDFKEVYDLIRSHLPGVSEAELDRKAVDALLASLSPKVTLTGEDSTESGIGAVTKASVFEGGVGYLRIGRVESGLAEAVRKKCKELGATNQLKGVVLDLRYTRGSDYSAAAAVADLFAAKEKPLLNWGEGMVRSKEKSDAFSFPVAVLVNHQTSGAAEALAAVLRETGSGLVLGSRTAGQALIGQEFLLKNGQRLRIGTAPIQLGDDTTLSTQGLEPDISVQVSAEDEKVYYADAFRVVPSARIATASLSATNDNASTNSGRRSRFNEAELVRERREGALTDTVSSNTREAEADQPIVHDPALARALDLLKGLAVVRRAHS